MGACQAHNLEAGGSKPFFAKFFHNEKFNAKYSKPNLFLCEEMKVYDIIKLDGVECLYLDVQLLEIRFDHLNNDKAIVLLYFLN